MDLQELRRRRLVSQQIAARNFGTAKKLVGWMGAMQAQDYGMAKWAIGIRLPNASEKDVGNAIDKAEILRTHLVRPTWQFVAAENIHWILELCAPKIKAGMRTRQQQLGLTKTILAKSNGVIEKALKGGRHLIRKELLVELTKAGIPIDENRASHLLANAELDGVICSGATKDGKPTYALLEEWVPKPASLGREAALARLARLFFTSRAPATLQDFTWWSGLMRLMQK